jgi:glycerol-3-phosphate dehydrogenase
MNLEAIARDWDVVIIGGGITGAGVFRETAGRGLRSLLVEQMDFAWGTSSRSSKLVHGGLRYLRQGHLKMTWDSVRERDRLLREAPGLVTPLEFIVPIFRGQRPGRLTFAVGLNMYDLMAGRRGHRYCRAQRLVQMASGLRQQDLEGGYLFKDAQTDDARLVLRLIGEGRRNGGQALNYTRAAAIEGGGKKSRAEVTLEDTESGQTRVLTTCLIINATGAWAEQLHPCPQSGRRLRPLRGSHLFFERKRLPLLRAVSFVHPRDRRAVFAIPWENTILVGTTDLDHTAPLAQEPAISPWEVDYLMEGLHFVFPRSGLTTGDCLASMAGVRSVLSRGRQAPSAESREHAVWASGAVVTVTGGKLTTFRRLARDALQSAAPVLARAKPQPVPRPACEPPPEAAALQKLDPRWRYRLAGRYGTDAKLLVADAKPENLEPIPETSTLWAELVYGARYEQIRHLDDLLLRRVRIGLLTPEGGTAYYKKIQSLVSACVPWDAPRWQNEWQRYRDIWRRAYAVGPSA